MTVTRFCFLWVGAWAVLATVWAWKYGWVNKTGRVPGWWQWGDAGWKAYSRAYPSGAFVIFFGGVTAFTGGAVARYAAGCMTVMAFLAYVVAAFSWPSIVMPPARRGDPGLFQLWWSRRRGAGHADGDQLDG